MLSGGLGVHGARVPPGRCLRSWLSLPRPLAGERASGSCRHTDMSGFVTVTSSRNQARGQGQPAATNAPTLPATHPARYGWG